MRDDHVIERDVLGTLVKLGDGGQGVVYTVDEVNVSNVGPAVYKEYTPQMRAMLDPAGLTRAVEMFTRMARPEAEAFLSIAAWPVALVRAHGQIAGFVMPHVPEQFYAVVSRPSGATPTRLAKIEFLLDTETYLARSGLPLTDGKRYSLLREIAGGMALLHRYGVVVDDLSPRNLLFSIDEPPACHFIDCDSMSIDGVRALPVVESPGWGIREVSMEPAGTIASDAYKFGLLALRLLSGLQHAHDIAALPPSVPDEVRRLIGQALATSPARRPPLSGWMAPLAAAAGSRPHFAVGHEAVASTGFSRSRRNGPFRAKQPFALDGQISTTPWELAEYLARHWKRAEDLVTGRELEELAVWLQQYRPSAEMLQALDSCRTRQFPPDRLIAQLITRMAPDVAPIFQGHSVDRASLPALASAARSGGVGELGVVHALCVSRALIAYAGLPSCPDFVQLDDRWQRNVSAVIEWRAPTPQLRTAVDAVGKARLEAELLETLLDDVTFSAQRHAAARADTATARSRTWFAEFRKRHRGKLPADLLPAYRWAILGTAPIAERQHAEEVARQQAAALAEEQRRAGIERELAALESLCRHLLLDDGGPLERYEHARELERDAAGLEGLLSPAAWLPPPALSDTALMTARLLADGIPAAVGRLRSTAERARGLAEDGRREVARLAAKLPRPSSSPPGPAPARPQSPHESSEAAAFRRRSVWTLVAVAVAVLTMACVAGMFATDAGPGGWLCVQVPVLLGCGYVVVHWFDVASDGFTAVHAERQARDAHNEAMTAYSRQLHEHRGRSAALNEHERRQQEFVAAAERRHAKVLRGAEQFDALAEQLEHGANGLVGPESFGVLQHVVSRLHAVDPRVELLPDVS
jgi:serine/threonine protein kinase